MSWWMIAPYLEHQVEIGKITREEADEQLKSIIEIDNRPELIIKNKDLKEMEDDVYLITGVEDELDLEIDNLNEIIFELEDRIAELEEQL